VINARASATRFCMPPEIWLGIIGDFTEVELLESFSACFHAARRRVRVVSDQRQRNVFHRGQRIE